MFRLWLILSILNASTLALQIMMSKDSGVIAMGSSTDIWFKIVSNHDEISQWASPGSIVKLDFNLTNEMSWAIELVNRSLEFSIEDVQWSREKAITLEAVVIGVDTLNVTPKVFDTNGDLLWQNVSTSFPIRAVLADRTLTDIFTVIMISMIIVNTVNMGKDYPIETLHWSIYKSVLFYVRGSTGHTNHQGGFQTTHWTSRWVLVPICHHATSNNNPIGISYFQSQESVF